MAGATPRHVLLAGRVQSSLSAVKQCIAFGSDLRVEVVPDSYYTYPDVTLACGKPVCSEDGLCLQSPKMIVEVSSPSTEGYDRGDKFAKAQRIASLRYYVIVAQDRMHVDLFTRGDAGLWIMSTHDEPGDVRIPELGWTLNLADLYREIDSLTEQ